MFAPLCYNSAYLCSVESNEINNLLKYIDMSKKYDYMAAVTEDIRTYLQENNIVITSENKEEMFEELTERLWVCDSVTGNGSGSYTFSTWKAEEYLCHNLDLLAEACDVTIRCYLLNECLNNVLDDVEVETIEEEEEEEEEE